MNTQQPPSPFPAHLDRPRLRPIEAFPVEYEGRGMIALKDAANLTDQVSLVTEAGLFVIQHFTGEHSLTEIASRFGMRVENLQPLVLHLDEALLLHGERFEHFRGSLLEQFDAIPTMPIRSSGEFTIEHMSDAVDAAATSGAFERFTASVKGTVARSACGIVVPHLDFERGRMNYALGYAGLCEVLHDLTFDRVVVLGTNHFGAGTGVVMCDKPHESNAGPIQSDRSLAIALLEQLGDPLVEHRIDHLREHSIELQMPWIRQYVGDLPTTGFLVHDPTVNDGESYDGEGVSLDTFVHSMYDSLDKLGGRTLFVASADLSHVGPEFGDETPNDDDRLRDVEAHDRRHLAMLVDHDLESFLQSMKSSANRTRWCTLGGMTALWRLLPNTRPFLINYHQATKHPAYDDLTHCCVTSAAMFLAGDGRGIG